MASARNLGQQEAAAQLVTMYLAAARFATRRSLLGLFRLVLCAEEINDAIEMLVSAGCVHLVRLRKNELVVYDGV